MNSESYIPRHILDQPHAIIITPSPETMVNWKVFADKTRLLLNSKKFTDAGKEIKAGLEKFPNQARLLTIASDVYHISKDHKKSLEYAELLITHHVEQWIGYGRAAQDLIVLKRVEEAQEKIKLGLEKCPNQVNLLTIASNVYRASNNHEKSLEYAELLITRHPEKWNKYVRVAEDLIALKRYKDLEILCTKIEEKSIQKDLEVTNDWLFTSIAGQSALKDLDDDGMYTRMRDFSEGRNIFIPVGDFCCGAQFVSDSGGRQYALPFDWLFINPNQVQTIIKNDFSDFVDFKNLQSHYPRRQCGHALYKNGNFFHHHDPSREPDRSAFIRRIERFKKLISVNTSDILFFNVRLSEKSDDLLDLLTALPENSKILSFVFLGNGSHEKPVVKHLDRHVLQIVFRCDNQNTLFAKNASHPSGFTDGIYIYCPYSRAYARSLLSCMLF